jgi:hypothetical protein
LPSRPHHVRARACRILAACALLVAGAPQIAAAEWHITPFIGFTLAGKTTIVDPQFATDKRHVDFGGAVALLGPGILGAEAIVVFTPGFFQTERTSLETDVGRVVITSSRSTAVMGNAVLTTPRRWTEYSLRPFVSGGFGLLRVSKTEESDVLGVHLNLAGFNIGGGAIGFLSQRTGVRFDVRYFKTVHDTDHGPGVSIGDVHLGYMTATVGVVIRR